MILPAIIDDKIKVSVPKQFLNDSQWLLAATKELEPWEILGVFMDYLQTGNNNRTLRVFE